MEGGPLNEALLFRILGIHGKRDCGHVDRDHQALAEEMKKQSLTNVSDSAIRKNLRTWRDRATSKEARLGGEWYEDAHTHAQLIADKVGCDVWTAAAVISALSPMNDWKRNKLDALNVALVHHEGGKPSDVRVCTFHNNKHKAWELLEGNSKALDDGSPKTWAFAKSIELTRLARCIVVDRWHMRACLTSSKTRKMIVEGLTVPQYNRVERLTISEADKLHEAPSVYQATLWLTIKRHWEGG